MVLAHRVGKKRGFLRGFLLTIATVGFYAVYWNYKAHEEVYKQFELAREDRDEGVIWYILGLIFPPLVFAYLWIFGSNVAYVRQRLELRKRTTAASFVGLLALGLGVFLLAWLLLFVVFALTEAVAPGASEAPETQVAEDLLGLMLLAGVVMLLVFGAYAYYRMQRDINEVWDAYDRRIAQVTAAAPFPRLVPHPPLAGHATMWAEAAAEFRATPPEATHREEGWVDRTTEPARPAPE